MLIGLVAFELHCNGMRIRDSTGQPPLKMAGKGVSPLDRGGVCEGKPPAPSQLDGHRWTNALDP